jgi:hypothetical protein
LDRKVRRRVGVVVAVEDVGGLVEVEVALAGEAARERAALGQAAEGLVTRDSRVGVDAGQLNLVALGAAEVLDEVAQGASESPFSAIPEMSPPISGAENLATTMPSAARAVLRPPSPCTSLREALRQGLPH